MAFPLKKNLNLLASFLPIASLIGQEEMTVIAHRGNSSEAPENTLSAFKSAALHKIPYIEFDLHLTKDGIPVVLHDRFLSRTTSLQYPTPIEQLTLAEVKSLDCGKWFNPLFQGEKILTLNELLDEPLENIGLMVEIKEGSAPDELLVSAVLGEISKHLARGANRPIVIGSLSANIVKLIKLNAPRLNTIGIVSENEKLFAHLDNDPDLIAPFKGIVTQDVVQLLHKKGKKVWVWTVDTPEELEYIKKCKADGVISNRPKIMQTLAG